MENVQLPLCPTVHSNGPDRSSSPIRSTRQVRWKPRIHTHTHAQPRTHACRAKRARIHSDTLTHWRRFTVRCLAGWLLTTANRRRSLVYGDSYELGGFKVRVSHSKDTNSKRRRRRLHSTGFTSECGRWHTALSHYAARSLDSLAL